jgi:hypothetical protein
MKSEDMPADLFLPKTLLQHLQNLHISQKCLNRLMWPAISMALTIIKTPGSHSSKIKKLWVCNVYVDICFCDLVLFHTL